MKTVLYLVLLAAGAGAWQFAAREEPAKLNGEAVYISEGCIHCHSQYSRPETLDTDIFGPPSSVEREAGKAVLIGNRRQGPDLSSVGTRRSREWNRAHLIDPSGISPGSRMPSYAHLFAGDAAKGEALLDYLQGLGAKSLEDWFTTRLNWEPSVLAGDSEAGSELYARACQQCHGLKGRGQGPMASYFSPKPADLTKRNFRFIRKRLSPEEWKVEVARVVKFGALGSSMPGHEYLTDQQIMDLVAYVGEFSVQAGTAK